MITQNPLIGRAKKKLAGVYSRTLWGKNIVQSCPTSTKGKQTPAQVAASQRFGLMSQLSNQVDQSFLNAVFYDAPVGRSRRGEWMQQLCRALEKDGYAWTFNPSLLSKLGGNSVVTQQPMIITPTQNQLRFSVEEFSAVNHADTSLLPCLLLICKDTNQCISLLPWETMEEDEIVLQNLSPTYLGHECYIFCLWQYNAGTAANPFYTYGAYRSIETL